MSPPGGAWAECSPLGFTFRKAEYGFSAVNDLLLKKINRLDITRRGHLRLKLTKLEPDIKSPCRRHDTQESY